LPRPFLVLATQNPVEYEGTFPLPEAQLDRFLVRVSLGYPSTADEKAILTALRREHPIHSLQPIVTSAAVQDIQQSIWDVHIEESLQDYIVALAHATRSHVDLALGASPRASFALFRAAQALAAVRGRDHVLPDDIKYLAPYVLTHRLLARPEAELRGRTPRSILSDVLEQVPLKLA